MTLISEILALFKERFPNYPVLAIWDAGSFYLVSIEIKSGNELADGYFKVGKKFLKIDERWGYQSHIEEFKKIIAKPAMYIKH